MVSGSLSGRCCGIDSITYPRVLPPQMEHWRSGRARLGFWIAVALAIAALGSLLMTTI
jgi:hypothetical protein